MYSSDSKTPNIPDYELIRRIGRGSYGDVWLAKGVTGLFRAIKIVWKERFSDIGPFDREYFGVKQFAKISLLDSNQLAVLHIGRNDDLDGGFFYYVMELADDPDSGSQIDPESYRPYSLRERLKQEEVIPVSECLNLGISLAHALETLHSRGLVHRDVKPSNILIVNDIPKLADIGLVTELKDGMTFVGTEGYIPPEGPGQPQADIFGLGKVLYELATGLNRKSFPKLPDDFPSRDDGNELLELNEILLKACDPIPARRYQNAEEMRQALLLVEAGKSVRRLYAAERGIRRAMRWVMVFGVIALLGFGGALIERKRADASEHLIEYAAGLTQARDAIEREDFGSARKQLSELSPSMIREKQPGFELRALNHYLGTKDTSKLIRKEGPSIGKIETALNGEAIAVHDSSGVITLLDTLNYEALEPVTAFRSLIGVTPNSKWYVGLGSHLEFIRVPVMGTGEITPFLDSPQYCYPLGMDRRGVGYAIDRSGVPKMVLAKPDGTISSNDLFSSREAMEHWEFYRGAVGPDGDLVFIWVDLSDAMPRFQLSWWSFDKFHCFTEVFERPFGIGIDETGPWVVMDTSLKEWRADLTTRSFGETGRVFPGRCSKRVYLSDNRQLIVSEDQLLEIESTDYRELSALKGHASEITDICYTGNTIYTGSDDGEVRAWELDNQKNETSEYQAWDPLSAGTDILYLDNERMIVPSGENRCEVINLLTMKPVAELDEMRVPIILENETIIGAGATGLVFFDRHTLEKIAEKEGEVFITFSYASSTKTLFCTDRDGTLWKYTSGENFEVLAEGWRYRFLSQSDAGGTHLWSVSTASELSCWNTKTRTFEWKIQLDSFSPYVAYSESSEQLYLALLNGQIEVRDSRTGKLIESTFSGTTKPESIVVNEEENRLFVGDQKGSIQIFRKEPLQYLSSIRLPKEIPLHDLNLSPDGQSLTALGSSGLIQVVRARNY